MEKGNIKEGIKIAGDLTVGDWFLLRRKLERDPKNELLWKEAFEFFERRLSTRYIQPIEAIELKSKNQGEGFAVCTLLCSRIEALEGFYQGRTYRKSLKGETIDESTEYFRSQPMFESFLKNREPFKQHFSTNKMALDFYENFRCALLHEGATRDGWTIRMATNSIIEKREGVTIINPIRFLTAIKEFIGKYRKELLASPTLKKAYIRKMDSICKTV